MARTVLVSACLLGLATRYDGSGAADPRVRSYLQREELVPVPVCPEQLGGLPTPRPPCRFENGDGASILTGRGRLLTAEGEDLTEAFRLGAEQALAAARLCGCRVAILKERSPSCGRHAIYRGRALTAGQGVACALLLQAGIEVLSEEDLPPAARES